MKQYLLLINLLCLFGCSSNETGQLKNKEIIQTNSIITANPSELNINDSILNDLTEKVTSQYYTNIHSVLIAKEGKLIYEEYFQGKDQNFGKNIGVRIFGDTSLHDIRSISKSVVSALIGISIDKGLIKGVDQPIAIFFPEMKFDEAKRNWTISHFLTMSSGLDWNENVPYNNPLNDEIKMTYSDDPVRYVLEKPLIAEPGKMFNYSGGDTQILAEIVERSSKMTINEFAKENLFKSLQISEFKWNKYAMWGGSEKFAAPSGLRLKSRDLLKIGLLYRNKGMFNNNQVLSEKWISESFKQWRTFPSDILDNDGYGYHFWVWADKIGDQTIQFIQANGNGDQNIYWDLKNDIIVIITAGNYNLWNSIENNTLVMLKKHIYPAIFGNANKQ